MNPEAFNLAQPIEKTSFTVTAVTIEPFPIWSLDDIEDKPITWSIENILTEGSTTIISGQPKAGKSWLAAYLGLCVATGKPAFGRYQTINPGRVLYFNAEDPPTWTKSRLQALMRGTGLNEVQTRGFEFKFLGTHSLKLDDPKDVERLKLRIADFKPTLCVFDPLIGIHSKNENKAEEISPILSVLTNLKLEFQTAIVLVVHEGKPSENKKEKSLMIRGSSAINAWRDDALFVDVEDADIRIQFSRRGRGPQDPLTYRLTTSEREGNIWTAQLNVTNAEQHDSDVKRAIISELTLHPEKYTTKTDLAKHTGKNYTASLKAIPKLFDEGKLEKNGPYISLKNGRNLEPQK